MSIAFSKQSIAGAVYLLLGITSEVLMFIGAYKNNVVLLGISFVILFSTFMAAVDLRKKMSAFVAVPFDLLVHGASALMVVTASRLTFGIGAIILFLVTMLVSMKLAALTKKHGLTVL